MEAEEIARNDLKTRCLITYSYIAHKGRKLQMDEEFRHSGIDFSKLLKIPETASQALLQGDKESASMLSVLAYFTIAGAFFANTIANLSVLIGGKLSAGFNELNKVFGWRWYTKLYRSMLAILDINLWPMVVEYFENVSSFPAHQYVDILGSLVFDSAVVRATRSQPFNLKALYDFYVEKKLYEPTDPALLLLEPSKVKEVLREVTIPFLSHVFPVVSFDTSTEEIKITAKVESPEEGARLLTAVNLCYPLSVIYLLPVLFRIHKWSQHKRKRSRKALAEVFKRVQTANYDPYLSPEEMARHTLLFVDSLLFKLTNDFYEMAGRPDLAYRPTGKFEEDLSKLWERASPEGHKILESGYNVRDVDELLNLIERGSYDLFIKVQKVPFEEIAAKFTELSWGLPANKI
jgi:hypothetical protein